MKQGESSMAGANHQYSSGQIRQKRPFRLVPVQKSNFDENRKNIENDTNILYLHQNNIIAFLGPPTSCSDLSRLGYTLNGYYIVNQVTDLVKHEVINLETVYCTFKQLEGSSNLPTVVEKRIGILKFFYFNISKQSSLRIL